MKRSPRSVVIIRSEPAFWGALRPVRGSVLWAAFSTVFDSQIAGHGHLGQDPIRTHPTLEKISGRGPDVIDCIVTHTQAMAADARAHGVATTNG